MDSLEKSLVGHCAPTLASLKTASLFCLAAGEALKRQVDGWDQRFLEKGVRLMVLDRRGKRSLIYMYRPARLREDLRRPGVAEFLTQYGYESIEEEYVLERLKDRLQGNRDFPHEIGIFLGYPLEDVEGFIRNRGKNCRCSGCWKVYGDQCEAKKQFARFRKCHRIYARLWRQGRSVWQLTVAA